MNIDQINRQHYANKDIYFRIGYGLASRLLEFHNETMTIELEIRKKWDADYDEAALEIAKSWRNVNDQLRKAKYCRVYIIDSKKFPYKRTLIHLGIRPGYDMVKGVNFS